MINEKFSDVYEIRNSHNDLTARLNFIYDKVEDTFKRVYDYIEEC